MKKFLRTLPGKTVTFIAFILSVCLFLGSIIGAIFMINGSPYNFYTYSEEEIVDKLKEDHYTSRGYDVVYTALNNNDASHIDSSYYYKILDENGKLLWETADNTGDAENWYAYPYAIKRDSDGKVLDSIYKNHLLRPIEEDWEVVTLQMAPKPGSSVEADFMVAMKILHIAYSLKYGVYAIAVLSLLLAIICFIALMASAGHKPESDEIFTGPLYKVPMDLMIATFLIAGVLMIYIGDSAYGMWEIVIWGISFVIELCVFAGLCMSAAVRIKLHTFWKNTLIYRLFILAVKILKAAWKGCVSCTRFLGGIIVKIPVVWKTAVFLFGISAIELIFIGVFGYSYGTDAIIGLFFLEKILLIPACIYVALCLKRLAKAGEALAGGDLSFVTDTKGMLSDLKKHGENLNNIASGMAIAVEDRMKSERMRTELITNVSHDIKTPLTSIINYATLIGNEHCENEKITEYSEVLVRQSERMKRLIEDLVEASKASTGNIEVNLAPCDASVFITQASGEYEDKLKKAELTLITKQPEGELRILSDGRRMWRVFDNLMNNICKYAQSGTRVYLSLERVDDIAVFTFKNTSREALDMSEEELMERFTRGDASRNTEGNGLGLSIAKSMAELQNGELKLSIDGDLFKAVLSFPVV